MEQIPHPSTSLLLLQQHTGIEADGKSHVEVVLVEEAVRHPEVAIQVDTETSWSVDKLEFLEVCLLHCSASNLECVEIDIYACMDMCPSFGGSTVHILAYTITYPTLHKRSQFNQY